MDYEEQRTFLKRQRWRLLPAGLGCGALLVQTVRGRAPLWARIAGGLLAFGLLWAAYYLPNYLGLDAGALRRPRWVARARWFVLALTGLVVAASQAWAALAAVLFAAVLHLVLVKTLLRPLPYDLREADPPRLTALAVVYAAVDFALLSVARGPQVFAGHGTVPTVLIAPLLLAFAFLALALLRPRSFPAQALAGAFTAALCFGLTRSLGTAAATFLWTAGVAHLYAEAVEQNLKNFDGLVENLQGFCNEPRETVVQMMAESGARLGEDWRRSKPQGQAEVTAWYSRNARLYLYTNCQHHLLYKHIVYTLGLLRLARGRVLDFGGGNGNFSRALARAEVDTTYLDVPGESADYLRWRAERERLPLKIVHELSELEGPYDVAYCLDVIEHLVDLEPVFERWRELLRPGGLLVATYYDGPNSTAPMHIDPGYDAREFLLAHGFDDVKPSFVRLSSAELLRKKHFMILRKKA